MNPFRLSSRVRPPPTGAWGAVRISAAVRARAAPSVAAAESQSGGGLQAPLPVPWRVRARSENGVIEVEHLGTGPAHSVRFALAGNGVLGLTLPGTVLPGERVRVVVRGTLASGCAAASDAMLMLRWFESDGREFLWPIALE